MRYNIGEMQIFATPKAEPMFQFEGLPNVTFEFAGLINTILFIHCGLVRASLRGGEDHFEVVGRLYSTYHPNQNEEKHEGKLYVRIYGYPQSTRFETLVERIEWHPDGSFDVITPDGQRHRVAPPKNIHKQSEESQMSKKVCPVCNGSGKCPTCHGHGGGFSYTCKTCGDTKKCPRCKGEGVVHS